MESLPHDEPPLTRPRPSLWHASQMPAGATGQQTRQALAHAREVANAPRSNQNDALSVARTTVLLVEDIGLLGILLDDWLAAPPRGPCPDAEDVLMVATSDVLAASAKVLAGQAESVPLERLEHGHGTRRASRPRGVGDEGGGKGRVPAGDQTT